MGDSSLKDFLKEYDIVPPESVAASKIIVDFWDRLGKPQDPLSKTGEKLMKIMIAVWEDLYPLEAYRWLKQRKEYKSSELTIGEQVKQHTGRSLASYPYPIYQMMKVVFPEFDPVKRENCIKMVKKFPIFQFANKV